MSEVLIKPNKDFNKIYTTEELKNEIIALEIDKNGSYHFIHNGKEIQIDDNLLYLIDDALELHIRSKGYNGFWDEVVSEARFKVIDEDEIRLISVEYDCDTIGDYCRKLEWKHLPNTLDLEEQPEMQILEVYQHSCNDFLILAVDDSGRRYEITIITNEKLIEPYIDDLLKAEWKDYIVYELQEE